MLNRIEELVQLLFIMPFLEFFKELLIFLCEGRVFRNPSRCMGLVGCTGMSVAMFSVVVFFYDRRSNLWALRRGLCCSCQSLKDLFEPIRFGLLRDGRFCTYRSQHHHAYQEC